MHECMYNSVYMYVDMHAYMCVGYVWRMTLSMSKGNKLVDLLWGKYLLFTSRQGRFLPKLQI